MQYVYEQDPGHGWLIVPKSELSRLGIADSITAFSYQNGPWVYLEEDCDMPVFLAAKEAVGEPVELTRRHVEHTPIRGYAPYSAPEGSL